MYFSCISKLQCFIITECIPRCFVYLVVFSLFPTFSVRKISSHLIFIQSVKQADRIWVRCLRASVCMHVCQCMFPQESRIFVQSFSTCAKREYQLCNTWLLTLHIVFDSTSLPQSCTKSVLVFPYKYVSQIFGVSRKPKMKIVDSKNLESCDYNKLKIKKKKKVFLEINMRVFSC